MLMDSSSVAGDCDKPAQRCQRRLTLEEVENYLVHDGGQQVTSAQWSRRSLASATTQAPS